MDGQKFKETCKEISRDCSRLDKPFLTYSSLIKACPALSYFADSFRCHWMGGLTQCNLCDFMIHTISEDEYNAYNSRYMHMNILMS